MMNDFSNRNTKKLPFEVFAKEYFVFLIQQTSQIILPEKFRNTENIFETILLGISYYNSELKKNSKDLECQQQSGMMLKGFAKGYYYINNLYIKTEVDFEDLYEDRIIENNRTLNTFIYNPPGFILPCRELMRFLSDPLQIINKLSDYNIDEYKYMIEVLKLYKKICDVKVKVYLGADSF